MAYLDPHQPGFDPHSKAERILNRIAEHGPALGLFFRHYRSRRGVPLLVIDHEGIRYSVTYFATVRRLKVRWPWGIPGAQQKVREFREWGHVLGWFARGDSADN